SKAVLYGSLAIFITAVYAAVVAGVGAIVGNQRSPLLAAAAAAVVAGAFQPGRPRAGRLANRGVYGRRAAPRPGPSGLPRRGGGRAALTPARTCCHRWPVRWRPERGLSRS